MTRKLVFGFVGVSALVAIAAVVVMFLPGAEAEVAAAQYSQSIRGDCVTLSIEVDNEGSAPIYEPPSGTIPSFIKGQGSSPDRYYRYVELEKGNVYGINLTSCIAKQEVCIGLAIDGRCTLTGEQIPAKDINQEETWPMGVVIDNDGYACNGWQTGYQGGKRFVVTQEAESFAVEYKDDPTALGTIVVAVFRGTRPKSASPQTRGGKGIGTGVGEDFDNPLADSNFQAMPYAYSLYYFRYATHKQLVEWGVKPKNSVAASGNRLFPGNNSFISLNK